MKTLLLACFSLGFALNASGSMVEANPAKRLAEEVLATESVTIEFYSREGKGEVTFSDRAWLHRLAKIMEQAPAYLPHPHCLCISYPMSICVERALEWAH